MPEYKISKEISEEAGIKDLNKTETATCIPAMQYLLVTVLCLLRIPYSKSDWK